jgi:hypothetical protein
LAASLRRRRLASRAFAARPAAAGLHRVVEQPGGQGIVDDELAAGDGERAHDLDDLDTLLAETPGVEHRGRPSEVRVGHEGLHRTPSPSWRP